MSSANPDRRTNAPSGVETRGGYPAGGSGKVALRPLPRNFPKRPTSGANGAGPKAAPRER
ncbi:hypothetical protein SAMN06264364_10592 [Quadrisphaera granulorum]|uniref:Uncharacterized protein n=1 Tax=Quadrisphaera granulorum TaxID=317664 RepID=A0A316AAT1_9ACTN|nr:hypothetical protein BXY45_10592 [Quadrisphaera granulorum]SZE95831.1 hypothetical protein SAMN06264364_10592 [Quadrisphaera granulorum]